MISSTNGHWKTSHHTRDPQMEICFWLQLYWSVGRAQWNVSMHWNSWEWKHSVWGPTLIYGPIIWFQLLIKCGIMKLLSDINGSVRIGDDAWSCSQEHTARYNSYIVMDLQTSKILDKQLVQVCIYTRSFCFKDHPHLRQRLEYPKAPNNYFLFVYNPYPLVDRRYYLKHVGLYGP